MSYIALIKLNTHAVRLFELTLKFIEVPVLPDRRKRVPSACVWNTKRFDKALVFYALGMRLVSLTPTLFTWFGTLRLLYLPQDEGGAHAEGDLLKNKSARFSKIDCFCFRPSTFQSPWVKSITKRAHNDEPRIITDCLVAAAVPLSSTEHWASLNSSFWLSFLNGLFKSLSYEPGSARYVL